MNPQPPGPRFRGGPPNGVQVGPGQQPVQDHRNGNLSPPMNNSSSGSTEHSAGQQSSRAEKFEDQKRRIIESCFHKKEPDGARKHPSRAKAFEANVLIWSQPPRHISPMSQSPKMHPIPHLLLRPTPFPRTRSSVSSSSLYGSRVVYGCIKQEKIQTMARTRSARLGYWMISQQSNLSQMLLQQRRSNSNSSNELAQQALLSPSRSRTTGRRRRRKKKNSSYSA